MVGSSWPGRSLERCSLNATRWPKILAHLNLTRGVVTKNRGPLRRRIYDFHLELKYPTNSDDRKRAILITTIEHASESIREKRELVLYIAVEYERCLIAVKIA